MRLVRLAHGSSGRTLIVNADKVILVQEADRDGVLLDMEGLPNQLWVQGTLDEVQATLDPPRVSPSPAGFVHRQPPPEVWT